MQCTVILAMSDAHHNMNVVDVYGDDGRDAAAVFSSWRLANYE